MCTVSAECFPRGEKCHFFNECFLFFLFFFFFLEGIYICTYLQPGCIYTVKNTALETQSVEKKKFL